MNTTGKPSPKRTKQNQANKNTTTIQGQRCLLLIERNPLTGKIERVVLGYPAVALISVLVAKLFGFLVVPF